MLFEDYRKLSEEKVVMMKVVYDEQVKNLEATKH